MFALKHKKSPTLGVSFSSTLLYQIWRIFLNSYIRNVISVYKDSFFSGLELSRCFQKLMDDSTIPMYSLIAINAELLLVGAN